MNRAEYMKRLEDAHSSGRISAEAYDAGVENADVFCDDDEDESENLPAAYAEIEYSDFDNPEAILGARFDDLNFTRYMER